MHIYSILHFKNGVYIMKEIHINDLVWLAGILEGDGHFTWIKRGCPSPRIRIGLIDKDTIEKIANMWGSAIGCEKRVQNGRKDLFVTEIRATKAQSWMNFLYDYLGERRRRQIDASRQVLNEYLKEKGKDDLLKCRTNMPSEAVVKIHTEKFSILERLKKLSIRKLAQEIGVSRETLRTVIKQWKNDTYVCNKYESARVEMTVIGDKNHNKIMPYYLAGLLEAEGWFMDGPPSRPNCKVVGIKMADEDVIKNVSEYWGVSYFSFSPKKNKTNGDAYKKMHQSILKGKRAIKFMGQIYPYMSQRRKEKIENLIV